MQVTARFSLIGVADEGAWRMVQVTVANDASDTDLYDAVLAAAESLVQDDTLPGSGVGDIVYDTIIL